MIESCNDAQHNSIVNQCLAKQNMFLMFRIFSTWELNGNKIYSLFLLCLFSGWITQLNDRPDDSNIMRRHEEQQEHGKGLFSSSVLMILKQRSDCM